MVTVPLLVGAVVDPQQRRQPRQHHLLTMQTLSLTPPPRQMTLTIRLASRVCRCRWRRS
jgi:hypothetical protein